MAAWLELIYVGESFTHIGVLNCRLIEQVCSYLGINTTITNFCEYILAEGKAERLAELCLQVGGTEYISGPAAKGYVQEQVFNDLNIKLTCFDYAGYPEYPQQWGDFVHEVTILDLLFNCGPDAH